MNTTNDITLQAHDIANIFPLIQGKEFYELCDDIEKHGLREPIWTYEGKILDGRNRAEACSITGVELVTRKYEGDEPLEFVLSLNLHRRHLNESQRGMVAASIANLESNHRKFAADGIKQSEAAEKLNVSERTVNSAKKVQNDGVPELAKKVNEGSVAVSTAAHVATLPKEEQTAIVSKGDKEIISVAKKIKEEKTKPKKKNASIKKLSSDFLIATESISGLNSKLTPTMIAQSLSDKQKQRLSIKIDAAITLLIETKKAI